MPATASTPLPDTCTWLRVAAAAFARSSRPPCTRVGPVWVLAAVSRMVPGPVFVTDAAAVIKGLPTAAWVSVPRAAASVIAGGAAVETRT